MGERKHVFSGQFVDSSDVILQNTRIKCVHLKRKILKTWYYLIPKNLNLKHICVKEASLYNHPVATMAAILAPPELRPWLLHSYTPHTCTVRPGFLTSSTPGFS